jgi:hypothetical protein
MLFEILAALGDMQRMATNLVNFDVKRLQNDVKSRCRKDLREINEKRGSW